jgi:hypothetical protein
VNSNLLFTDATYDIGASGATRPRDLFLSRNLTVGGTLTLAGGVNLNGNVTVGDSSADTLTINSTITSNLIFTDNTYDIGASGATRPRNLFLAGNATIGGAQTLTGALTVDSTTDSTSTTTGSIQTDGGIGVAKQGRFGSTVLVKTATSRANITTDADLVSENGLGILSTSTTYGQGYQYVRFFNSSAAYTGSISQTASTAIGLYSAGDLTFGANSTAGATLTSTGLGIGTSSPVGRLNLLQDGTSNTTPALRITGSSGDPSNYYMEVVPNLSGATISYRFNTKNVGTYNDVLVLGGTGNVGIGTSSPDARLVSNYGSLAAINTADIRTISALTLTATDPGSVTSSMGVALTLRPVSDRGSVVAIVGYEGSTNKEDSGVMAFLRGGGAYPSTMSESMRITNAGSVGINTTSPSYLLDVNGTFRSSVTGGSMFTSSAGGIPRLYIGGNGFGFNRQSASEDIFFGEPGDTGTWRVRGAGTISLGVGNTATTMTIVGNNGNVGIGDTSPSQKLNVTNSATNAEGFRVIQTTGGRTSGGALGLFYDDQAGTTQATLQVIQNGTGDILQLFDGGTQVVAVKDGGNVSIGTNTSPATKLHVNGSSPAVRIDGTAFGNSGAKLQILGWASGEPNWQIDTASIANGLEFVPSTAVGGSTFSTPAFSMLSSGIFTVTQGIQFPATQVASGGANVLDDYEEGTFTPTDTSGASLTFSSATGTYTKIGRLVTLVIRVVYPSTVNASAAKIGNFPFVAVNNPGGFLIGSDAALNLNFRIDTTTSTHIASGGTFTAVTNATLSTKELQFSYVYFT